MNEMLPRPPQPETRTRVSPTRTRRGRFVPLFVAVVLLIGALVGLGAWVHLQRGERATQAQQQEVDFRPTLRTTVAKRVDTPTKLTLPGTTLAFDQANIYARATGYIAERHVDFGSRVRKGDLLVRIAAPDLDAQLAQAVATLGQTQAALVQARAGVDQARANLKLAGVTNYRTTTLANQGWEPRQSADNTTATLGVNAAGVESALAGVTVAEANVKAQQATVDRLRQLTDYERVTAPFDGVVTSRTVDVGDLLTADAGGGRPMFVVQRDDVIRVQTYVPQSGTVGLRAGLPASAVMQEMPDHPFHGQVARTAAALDPATRTLLVQVDVDNTEHLLHPGVYLDVTFQIPRTRPGVVVPAEAVLFNASGLRVAVVGADGRVHFRPVTIRRDFGTAVELNSGLDGGEAIVLSPPTDLRDGQAVTVEASRQHG